MYKTVLLNSYIDKRTEISDIAYNARKNHPFAQIGYGAYVLVELEDFDSLARVTSRLVELLQNVL